MTVLADHLRSLPDDTLAALLQLRPDLVVPVPTDLSTLALRAQSRGSVARALDGLDQFSLQLLDAVRLTRDPETGQSSVDAVLALASTPAQGVEPAVIRAVLDRLTSLLLVYGPPAALRVVTGVDEACSPYLAGLGRKAADLDPRTAELCADPARLRRTLLSAPPAARAVLDRLAAGPPVGTLPPGALDAPPGAPASDGSDTISPVRWLVENRLLVPLPDRPAAGGSDFVELPREIGLLLRRDCGPLGPLRPTPPALATTEREPKLVDSAGTGQALQVVRETEALLEELSTEPAPLLRSGGIGVRDLRRLSRNTGVDEKTTALLLEVAYAAGLIGVSDLPGGSTRTGVNQQVLPTDGYEKWRDGSLAQRWEELSRAWLAMPRQASLVGQRDDRDRPISALSAEVERITAPGARRAVLDGLAGLDPGAAPTADDVLALLDWRLPRLTRGREAALREELAAAALLGLTGLGALTSYARMLLNEAATATSATAGSDDDPLGLRPPAGEPGGEPYRAVQVLDALLPAPVDHFLVQTDLTVVVPGPPEPGLAAELRLVAEQESAGGASVHRVTPVSVRRALDSGYTAGDLHALFSRRSRTPIPQSLTYLVDDVARKHGGLRVGAAGAYLRSDDAALLVEVLADRRLSALSLRRLAPTVLVTPQQAGRLLAALREAGYTPMAEDAAGAVLLRRPKPRRAPARMPAVARISDPLAPPQLNRPRALGIVEQLRRGDAAARAARRAPKLSLSTGRDSPGGADGLAQAALAVLQQAVRDKVRVWVGYVDTHGAMSSRLVRPVSIGGGYLRAEDERTEMLHTFALHRITAATFET